MAVIVGLSGSLRRDSYNRQLLEAAAAELPAACQLAVFDQLATIPPYSEDQDERAPDAVRALRTALDTADGVLIATPEYNSSVPGQLKNVLDWASRPFPDNALRDKPAAVMGASTGLFGAIWAQAELRKVLRTIGARVIETELPVGQAHEAFTGHGTLADPAHRATLGQLVGELLCQTPLRTEVCV